MTLNGAIMQLVEMRENSMMPEVFKPYFDKVIETVSECEEPSAQPTLYGYKIEHLALIAKVMEKEGVTPEIAVQTFGDIQRMCQMLIDEMQERIRIEFETWRGEKE